MRCWFFFILFFQSLWLFMWISMCNFSMSPLKIYFWNWISWTNTNYDHIFPKIWNFKVIRTVETLNADTLRDKQKCPSYRGVRLIEVILEIFRWDIDKCPSYGITFLRGFTLGQLETKILIWTTVHPKAAKGFIHSLRRHILPFYLLYN